MRCRLLAAVFAYLLIAEQAAFAHRIDEYLQATLLTIDKDRVQASMRLIPGVLVSGAVIAMIDANRDGVFSDEEERGYAERVLADIDVTLDGKSVRPRLASWSFPQPAELRDGLGEIHLEYIVDLLPGRPDRSLKLENRHLRERSVYLVNVVVPENGTDTIVGQRRNERQSVYALDFQQVKRASGGWTGLRLWLPRDVQFATLFQLGMRHIAEGTDHLLFLLTLLLPAPLLACGSRWSSTANVRTGALHTLGIVTAFTVGHSITLALGAFGTVRMSPRPVEVLIAVSILLSAIHALRPIFPGREAWIAGLFGLVHGLAFAATLYRLGLMRWNRAAGILAFNLGIEAMQMMVVAAVLPSLMLMSRSRAYSVVRIVGASCAGAASLVWIVVRLFGIEPGVDASVNVSGWYGVDILGVLFVASLLCWRLLPRRFVQPTRDAVWPVY